MGRTAPCRVPRTQQTNGTVGCWCVGLGVGGDRIYEQFIVFIASNNGKIWPNLHTHTHATRAKWKKCVFENGLNILRHSDTKQENARYCNIIDREWWWWWWGNNAMRPDMLCCRFFACVRLNVYVYGTRESEREREKGRKKKDETRANAMEIENTRHIRDNGHI